MTQSTKFQSYQYTAYEFVRLLHNVGLVAHSCSATHLFCRPQHLRPAKKYLLSGSLCTLGPIELKNACFMPSAAEVRDLA